MQGTPPTQAREVRLSSGRLAVVSIAIAAVLAVLFVVGQISRSAPPVLSNADQEAAAWADDYLPDRLGLLVGADAGQRLASADELQSIAAQTPIHIRTLPTTGDGLSAAIYFYWDDRSFSTATSQWGVACRSYEVDGLLVVSEQIECPPELPDKPFPQGE